MSFVRENYLLGNILVERPKLVPPTYCARWRIRYLSVISFARRVLCCPHESSDLSNKLQFIYWLVGSGIFSFSKDMMQK